MATFFGYPYDLTSINDIVATEKTSSLPVIDTTDIASARLPQFESLSSQGERITFITFTPLAVTKASKNGSTAWNFITFLESKNIQEYLFKKGHSISPQLPLLLTQSKDPTFGSFATDATFAQAVFIPNSKTFQSNLESLFSDYLSGTIDELRFITAMKEQLQCDLQKLQGTLPADSNVCKK